MSPLAHLICTIWRACSQAGVICVLVSNTKELWFAGWTELEISIQRSTRNSISLSNLKVVIVKFKTLLRYLSNRRSLKVPYMFV